MLLFIGSEAFFFIALIIAYVYYRNFTRATDIVSQNLDVVRAGIFTVFLVASSVTFLLASRALKNSRLGVFRLWMGITLVLGLVFLAGQLSEYAGLYEKQLTMSRDIFGSSFFLLTGFHGLHVILGLIVIAILLYTSFGPMKNIARIGLAGTEVYWHFVDVVWLFVFFFVYVKHLL